MEAERPSAPYFTAMQQVDGEEERQKEDVMDDNDATWDEEWMRSAASVSDSFPPSANPLAFIKSMFRIAFFLENKGLFV